MDCNCNCFGMAASSKRPVKRYNLLVPDIFPAKLPAFTDKIDPSTERKIKKLYEYLDKNLHRCPKVSRRLARRVNKELAARRYGYVQVAVAAYIYLLDHLRDADSALFAREVICQQVASPTHFYHHAVPAGCASVPSTLKTLGTLGDGAVRAQGPGQHCQSLVGILLSHDAIGVRILGAQLLAEFIKQQNGTEYLQIIEAFVPQLVENIEAQGKVAEVSDRDSSSTREGLQIACLRSLKEQIRLHARILKFSAHLETVEVCLLDLVNSTNASSPAYPLHPSRTDELRRESAGSSSTMSSFEPGTARSSVRRMPDTVDSVASEVLEELGRLAQDPAEGTKIVDILLRYEDEHQSWPSGPDPKPSRGFQLLSQVCADEQQRYVLYTALVRHVAAVAPGLQPAVLQTACQQGVALPPSLASPALILAIKELAPVASAASTAGSNEMRAAVLACILKLAEQLEDQAHLLEALGGVAGKLPGPSSISTAVLECMLAAARAAHAPPAKEGTRHAPPFRQVVLQELTAILVQWEEEQRLLAHALLQAVLPALGGQLRVQQASPLLSAVWYEVALESSPKLFVALGGSLEAIMHQSPPALLREAASLALALQAEALSSSSGRFGDPTRCLSVLLLCAWLWGLLAERVPAPRLLELRPDIDRAQQLRLTEGGLQLDDAADAAADATNMAASLEHIKRQAAPLEAQQQVLAAVWSTPEETNVVGEDSQLFKPVPVSNLQPRARVGSSWFGGALSAGSRAATNDFAQQRLPDLTEARSSTLESNAPRGILTVHDLLAAAKEERATLQALKPTNLQPAQLSPLALKALAAVDAILGEDGIQVASREEPAIATHHTPEAQPIEAQNAASSRDKLGAASHEVQCIAEDGGGDHEQHRGNGIAHTEVMPGKSVRQKAAAIAGQNGEVQAV